MIELYASYIALFVLTITTLYVMIKVSNNHLLLFVLIPILVGTGIIAGWAVTSLHGLPIAGYPKDKVMVLAATVEKPTMHITVRYTETGQTKLHSIPYTKQSARLIQNMADAAQKHNVMLEGRFNSINETEIEFLPEHMGSAIDDKAPEPTRPTAF